MPDAEMRFGGDASKLVAEYQKITQSEKNWQNEIDRTINRAAKREAQLTLSTERHAAELKRLETQGTITFDSIDKKIGATTTVMAGLAEASRKAFEQLKEMGAKKEGDVAGLGRLGELAHSDADMKRLVDQAYALVGRGVTETPGEAGKLVFALESLHIKGRDASQIADLKKFGVINEAEDVAKSVTVMQRAMGEKAGTFNQLLSKGIAASIETPKQFQDIMIQSGLAAPTAKMVGLETNQLLAGMGVLTQATGEATEASTMMQAFATTMGKRGLQGRTLQEAIKDISGSADDRTVEQMTEAQAVAFFGRKEGRKAYQLLKGNMGMLDKTEEDITASTNADLAAQKVGFAARSPDIAAGVAEREAKGQVIARTRQKQIDWALLQARTESNKDGTIWGNFKDWLNQGGYSGGVAGWFGANAAAADWGGGTADRQLRGVAAGAGAPQVGPEVPLNRRPYQRRGIVIPQVPEESDPEIVGIRAREAETELKILDRDKILRQNIIDRGRTPSARDEARFERDPERRELINVLRGVQNELKHVEARRRINANSANAGPPK